MILDHIQLAMPVGQENEARAFYLGIFDMAEEAKPERLASRGGCWFRKDAIRLHMGVEDPFSPQGKAHPAFAVEDIEDLGKKLSEAGFPTDWDITISDRKRFFTADPFGNRIEIMQSGDGFSQR